MNNTLYQTAIPFTQYLRPDGRKRSVFFDATPDVYGRAKILLDAGYFFEAELLPTQEVVLSISDGHEDIAMQVCPNGPGIENGIEELIQEAETALFKKT